MRSTWTTSRSIAHWIAVVSVCSAFAALEEEPDPEPRDHADDGVEGVHYGSSFRCSFSTRRSHRHLATTPHQRQREDVGETQPGLDPVPIGQEGFIEKRDEIPALK